jgi:hypothetical protein
MTARLKAVRQLLALAALALPLTFAPALHAQGQGGGGAAASPADRAAMQLTQLTEQLTLTPAQVVKIKPILLKQATDRQEMMAKAQGGDMTAVRAQMTTLNTAVQAQITALLTDAQKPLYEKALEAQRNRGFGGGAGGAGGPPAAR